MIMQQYRYDSCERPFPENELIRIRAMGTTWFRFDVRAAENHTVVEKYWETNPKMTGIMYTYRLNIPRVVGKTKIR